MATPRTVIISVNESTIDYLRLNENKIVLVFDRSTPTGAIFHPTPEYIGKNLSSSYGKGRLSLKKTRFRKFVILTKLEAIVEHLKLKGNPVLVRSVSIVSKSSCADVFAILVFSGFSPRSSQHTSLVPVEVQRDIFNRPPTMVGKGKKHHATYGKMIGHGVTAVYRNKDGASFDVFRRGGVEDYSNTVIMLFIDSMSKCLEEWIPGFTKNGNIIPAILYQNCSPKWHEKFDLSHFNSICGLFSGWSCFSTQTKKFHQDPDCSYTIIGVPHDDFSAYDNSDFKRGRGSFQFCWDGIDSNFLELDLTPGTVLYYAGYTIHHRQNVYDNGYFFNVACYHNKRFFDNIKTSISRQDNN